ncbi:MAG: tRNA uridine-5-carboxymethylaminomethyl(34) synthesis GTPase MnmE [Bacteroidetes bacterium]|nr:tRNA uridine-5-carboxymethylaminomethyl(34) synthesis GTPase MnmE [Bacteroidota bacterium]
MSNIFLTEDTICAPATTGGAIAIIRISGHRAFDVADKIFKPQSKSVKFKNAESHKMIFGCIYDGKKQIDQVLATKFIAPNSYNGENIVEFSCHASNYVVQEILRILIDNKVRMANPGEFTMRAFLNGKMDLSQAEAVADLIAANSKASHTLAYRQMRGHFSKNIQELRQQLVEFASLIELELDFSEEDVEFASRKKLEKLLKSIKSELKRLTNSFAKGNVLKHGIPVAIIGKPNVGKSTLLNAIFNEEKAIVSEIPGTTRDAIEDTIIMNDIAFRFIDTAGLRESGDEIENIGMKKTMEKVQQAAIVLYLFDISCTSIEEIKDTIDEFRKTIDDKDKKLILIANKIDLLQSIPHHFKNLVELETIFISAKRKENIQLLTDSLLKSAETGIEEENQTIVTNSRHYEALTKALEAIDQVKKGMDNNISGDLLAIDLRTALYYLGSITGQVTSNEILDGIFEKFCIGK